MYILTVSVRLLFNHCPVPCSFLCLEWTCSGAAHSSKPISVSHSKQGPHTQAWPTKSKAHSTEQQSTAVTPDTPKSLNQPSTTETGLSIKETNFPGTHTHNRYA